MGPGDGLNACRAIYMPYSWNLIGLFGFNIIYKQHKRGVTRTLKPVAGFFFKHHRGNRPKIFAILYLI